MRMTAQMNQLTAHMHNLKTFSLQYARALTHKTHSLSSGPELKHFLQCGYFCRETFPAIT